MMNLIDQKTLNQSLPHSAGTRRLTSSLGEYL